MTIPPVDLPPLEPRFADGPAYLGPTTFCRVPQLSTPEQLDAVKPDIAIVGAPWDDGVTYRPGARFGPRAVRTASYQTAEWHLELEVAPLEVLRVIDYGDAMCLPGMAEVSHAAIRERVGDVAQRQIIPMVIGGDHSITWPSATAVAAAYPPGSVGIVHFDAHADTGDDQWGNLYSHGSPMRRLIESGVVPGRNFVQVGLRGYWPPKDVFDWMREQGMRWHLMGELRDRGVVAGRSRTRSLRRSTVRSTSTSPSTSTCSIPGFAPGTGTPEPGGMQPVDLLRAIRQIALRTDVVAMDVVEVSPPYDWAELTSQNAHRCLLEAISALAVKRRDGR